jgi:hypothetical protein
LELVRTQQRKMDSSEFVTDRGDPANKAGRTGTSWGAPALQLG